MQTAKNKYGVGASVLRKEDDRHLRGRGEFVADIRLPGTQHVVFLRSPHAHARIRHITVPPEAKGSVFTAADLPNIQLPTLVVVGTGDLLTPPGQAHLIVRLIPDAKLEVFPGGGHMLMLERSDELNRLIVNFAHDVGAHAPGALDATR